MKGQWLLAIVTLGAIALGGCDKKQSDESRLAFEALKERVETLESSETSLAELRQSVGQLLRDGDESAGRWTKLEESLNQKIEALQVRQDKGEKETADANARLDRVQRYVDAIELTKQRQEAVARKPVDAPKVSPPRSTRPAPAVAASIPLNNPPPSTVSAPFMVVGIDRWGGASNVVFLVRDKLQAVSVKQSIEGWTVESVDAQKGAISMRDPNGALRTFQADSI